MATRLELRTRARIRADQDNSTFADDNSYNYWLDEAAKETWYDLIQAGWPINFSFQEGTASAQLTTLGISGTVAFIRGVYRKDSGGYVELSRVQEGQRAGMLAQAGNTPTSYDVRIDPTNGPTLELLPAPGAGVIYRVEYILEHPGFLASDATVWYGPARSDELLVLSAAAKAARKEGNDQGASQLDRERLLMLEKVTNMASWFDMRNSPKIRDVGSMTKLDPFAYQVDGLDPIG
jgi:hypothetical protein